MPQLTMEYSDNLEVDAKAVFARLHEELVATGAVSSVEAAVPCAAIAIDVCCCCCCC